ncbi:MAG: DUF4926 domain-containing protein [Cyanobacteria bacterium J06623_4]
METVEVMIKELDIVRLTHELEEYELPEGSHGTVVHCYEGGKGFEVEFIEPPHVLTLDVADIKLDKSIMQSQVTEIMDYLPEEIAVEVRDFAESLKQKYLTKAG